MNKQEHLKVLQDRHEDLKTTIKEEYNKHHLDGALISGLKRKKLHLKDEIHRFLESVEE